MLNNIVSIEEFRTNLADLVGRVMYGKNRVTIKKYNRNAAILLSIDDFEKLIDPTKRLNESQWTDAVRKLDSLRVSIPEFEPKNIEEEVNTAVKEVRIEKENKNA